MNAAVAEKPFNADECHLVIRNEETGGEVWLGNKVGALTFEGEKLCVLEPPHCAGDPKAKHMWILDHRGVARREKLDAAAAFIAERVEAGAKLLVHCGAGMERSPLTVAWWLVSKRIFADLSSAYELLKAVRECVADRGQWVEPLPHQAGSEPMTEQQKYEEMWKHPEYRKVAPGEHAWMHFIQVARPRPGTTVIDFGCGTGRGAFMLALMGPKLKVAMVDFAENCLDDDVRQIMEEQPHALSFTQADLSQEIPVTAEFGFCTDVLEHIPPEQVDAVLQNILKAAQHVYFQISCTDDSCGALIGEPLHLSVHPASWWLEKFQALGCQVHFVEDRKENVILYATAWATGREIVNVGTLNTEDETIIANVRKNLGPQYPNMIFGDAVATGIYYCSKPIDSPEFRAADTLLKDLVPGWRQEEEGRDHDLWHLEGVLFPPWKEVDGSPEKRVEPNEESGGRNPDDELRIAYWWGNSNLYVSCSMATWETALLAAGGTLARWNQIRPHLPNGVEVMIVGGGPSLEGQLETIRRFREEGKLLVTMNGAYNWALEKGLKVSGTIVCDARPFNARFTHPVAEGTYYFVGSQCDPSVLEGLPRDRTWLWHTTADLIRPTLEECCPGPAENPKAGRWRLAMVGGGSTVLLRAIPMLRMLGYSKFHLFGCDSCVASQDGAHHAYEQKENDGAPVFPTIVGGRTFWCTKWNTSQAQEFMDLIRRMGELFELEVYGNGLLAWILQHGANLDIEREEAEEAELGPAAATMS